MPFAELKKTYTARSMPFSIEISEHTKFMTLDSWIHRQIKDRQERMTLHSYASKEWLEGYEQGIIDLALDLKNEIKRLDT
jgi:hypothetical protein